MDERLLRVQIEQELIEREPQLSQAQRQRRVEDELAAHLTAVPKGRLNHRDAIRASPPHILITNFSMLEYLLERPVDASIFEMPGCNSLCSTKSMPIAVSNPPRLDSSSAG